MARPVRISDSARPAGVFRDVAADRAGDLGGWIGGVIEALVLDIGSDPEIGDAGLHDEGAVVEIDVGDTFERLITGSTASSSGSAPPESEVPEPRGTTLMLRSLQYFRMRDTCFVVSGSTTTSGSWR